MIQANEIHLWSVVVDEVPDFGQVSAHLAILSSSERARMERFRFPIDRRMYGVSHALVRRVLARYVGLPPELLTFSLGAHGKPALTNTSQNLVQFNLTHTRGLAALVVSAGREVGIDAERGDRTIGIELAERIYSERERDALSQLPDRHRARAMIRLWTLKEAYVKALGVGLRLSVSELTFLLADDAPPRFDPNPTIDREPERWHFIEVDALQPYVLSLAVENRPGDLLALRAFNGAALLGIG